MGDKLDEQFISTMLEIEKSFEQFNRHDRIRIEKWTQKLCQVTSNSLWKKNRNNYANMLYKMITNQKLEDPFNKGPPDGPLPKLANSYVNTARPATRQPKRVTPTAKN